MKIMQTYFQKGSHISSLVPEDGRLRSTLSQDWLIALIATVNIFTLCLTRQHAKKGMSDSPGLVDFAIRLLRLVNSVLNFPNWQMKFFREFRRKKNFLGLVKKLMILGLMQLA